MPNIQSTIEINAPRELVWTLAQDVTKFPDIMPDLDEVKVLEESSDGATRRTLSEWHGRIQKFNRKMTWTEEDFWDDAAHTCRFNQTKGDFDEYRGDWRFEENGEGTRVALDLDYAFNIPLIGNLMQKVVKNLIQENADNMLQALKTEAERRAAA